MIQEQSGTSNQIYTDYHLGMRPNLVDRDIYKLKVESDPASKNQQMKAEADFKTEEPSKEDLEIESSVLKQKMSEKLKFVLSDKEIFDPYENQKKMKKSKQFQISSKFRAADKIQVYGGKIEDPFKINQFKINEIEKRVFTAPAHQNDEKKRLLAVKLINNSFEQAKTIKVGMQKPGKSNVYAKKVYNIFPQFDAIPHKVLHVMNDDKTGLHEKFPIPGASKSNQLSQSKMNDEIKDKIDAMKESYKRNNGQVLLSFTDKSEDQKKFALYKLNHKEKLPSDLAHTILGKRSADQRIKDLEEATQYEFVRDYNYTQQQLNAKNEYVIKLDNVRSQMTFLPIKNRIALVKKKKSLAE